MSSPVPCVPCCTTPQTVNVPGVQGLAGSNGTNGTNGVSAFTTTTQAFTIPAVGSTVTVQVGSTAFMVIGQVLIIGQGNLALANPGPMTCVVTVILGSTSMTVKALGYPGDKTNPATIDIGAIVSPAGVLPSLLSAFTTAYGAGTAYTLTNTPAEVNFGTTPLSITLPSAGTYLLFAAVRYDYVGTTYAANHTLTQKIRDITAAGDVANSSAAIQLAIVTTLNQTIDTLSAPVVTYVAAGANTLQVFASFDVAPGAGSVQAITGFIMAVKLF